jgi:hypothetical protein
MHDIHEGVCPVNIECMMCDFKENKQYSVEELNEDLRKYKYGKYDGENKVPYDLFTEKCTFRLSARDMSTFVRIFPLICGERLKNNVKYLHFLKLLEIMRNLYAEAFDETSINALADQIDTYLTEFKMHYPDVPLKPKHHFLTHYPNLIRKFGPPRAYCTIRFESKHSYFKSVEQATNNHRNLYYSLAQRHQGLQLYHLLSPNYFIELGYGPIETLDNLLKTVCHTIIGTENVDLLKWVLKRGITYHRNALIITGIRNNMPIFSRIKHIVLEQQTNNVYFLIEELLTIEYVNHFSAYKLQEIEVCLKKFEFTNLVNAWPLDYYNTMYNYKLVVPKYSVYGVTI